MCIADILCKLRAPGGRYSLFQGIYKVFDISWRTFYCGTEETAKQAAEGLARNLAGNLRFFLQRQGWQWKKINNLIKKCFTDTAAHNARLARYDKATKRVISGSAVLHSAHNASLDRGFIKRDLGLTNWERKQQEEKEAEEQAAA